MRLRHSTLGPLADLAIVALDAAAWGWSRLRLARRVFVRRVLRRPKRGMHHGGR